MLLQNTKIKPIQHVKLFSMMMGCLKHSGVCSEEEKKTTDYMCVGSISRASAS